MEGGDTHDHHRHKQTKEGRGAKEKKKDLKAKKDGSRKQRHNTRAFSVANIVISYIHFVEHGENTWMFNERGELILGRLSPDGFEEISRAALIAPTFVQLNERDGVCWTHPAFAYRHVFVRNDEEMRCFDLRAE